VTEHGRLFDDVAEAYDRFRPSPDLIEAPGGTCRSSHFATLVTVRAAGPRT
jgi:hypothetical protein